MKPENPGVLGKTLVFPGRSREKRVAVSRGVALAVDRVSPGWRQGTAECELGLNFIEVGAQKSAYTWQLSSSPLACMLVK